MKTASEIQASLIAKADEDETFRTKLLSDPKGAIQDVTGFTVPDSFSVHVHEEGATDFHIVLPPAGSRLSDKDLRDASGGFAPGGDSW